MEKFTKEELSLFEEGTCSRCFDRLGARPGRFRGKDGCFFAVWAPGVKSAHVAGSFNSWKRDEFALKPGDGGVWYGFVPGAAAGDLYKYVFETASGDVIYKADPFARWAETPPGTASRVADIDGYQWRDGDFMASRASKDPLKTPVNIYEVHCGSWKRRPDGGFLTYRELAKTLVPYAADMGYTHIELMPVMEHPFDGSWGYQITGYYAPTSRYGTPEDFMCLVDACHRAGLGVILDWVPGHFCRDAQGLGRFTGEKLFEKGDHSQWGTYKFDLARGGVRSFLLSNAVFWLEKYHADGLRVDGVSSMLYLNFGVEDEKQKIYNEKGTEEDLDAVSFLQGVNGALARRFPGVMLIAEESSAWPLVTYPPEDGGLGFHFKWDMGWMNDTLHYMQTDFPYRPSNHKLLTFSMMYAFNENFILPLSHDEVVHGKCSLIGRMPGDYWRQFAGMRLLAMYQTLHSGAKLNFMGNEIAQFIEWRYYEGVEWFLAEEYDTHEKERLFIRALNRLFLKEPALWQKNYSWEGFRWLEADDAEQSVLAFERRGDDPAEDLTVILNFRPDYYEDFRVGVPRAGKYREIFNSDDVRWGGSGQINEKPVRSEPVPWHGEENSVSVSVPPLGGTVLKRYR